MGAAGAQVGQTYSHCAAIAAQRGINMNDSSHLGCAVLAKCATAGGTIERHKMKV